MKFTIAFLCKLTFFFSISSFQNFPACGNLKNLDFLVYSLMWILIYTTRFIRMYNLPQFYNYIFLTPGTFTYLSPGLFGCVLAERARQDTKIAGGHVAFPGMYYLYSDEWNKKPLGFSCSDSAPLRSTIGVRELTLVTSLSLLFLFLPLISFSSLSLSRLPLSSRREEERKAKERCREKEKKIEKFSWLSCHFLFLFSLRFFLSFLSPL